MRLDNSGKIYLDIRRITALWAFSEAAFGGILHALKIPFTGLFIGSAAVIFITLIASTSKEKSSILKSTMIVILVKAVVSPHSPLAAYFAVFLQGILGYVFFSIIKNQRAAAIILGFTTLLFSALQRLILLTLLFGNTLWNALDLFVEFVLTQIGIESGFKIISFSYSIILLYTGIHIMAGLLVGGFAVKLPSLIMEKYGFIDSELILKVHTENYFSKTSKPKKKPWLLRPTGIVIIIISIAVITITYISPKPNSNIFYEIIIMLIRSLTITIIWFGFISPFLFKQFSKVIEKKKYKYASEINQITSLFPNFIKIINYSWKESSVHKGTERIKFFFMHSLALLLTVKI